MDPLSIVSLVEACAGLAVTAGKLAIGLKSIADNYKQSALSFRSLSSQCKLFATAVRAIQAWMEEAPETTTIDDRIWEQLADSFECANDAIYALENELVNTSGTSVNTFWNKANVVWNLQNMKDLEDCIHKQICSLSVIQQIMNLPTRQSQTNTLQEKSSVFQESRSSVMSLRDAETSTLRGGGDASSTIRAPSTIMTRMSQLPQFDFDEMLLTSQVYLRNRNKTLAMNDRITGAGKMRDSETSVSTWDLPPKSEAFDLRAVARQLDEGNIEKVKVSIETNLVQPYELLQSKYSKVKRYYFERAAQVEQLAKEIEALKGNNPDVWSNAAVESEKHKTIEVEGRLRLVQEMNSLLQRQLDAGNGLSSGRWSSTALLEAEKRKTTSAEASLEVARESNANFAREIERLKKQMDWYKIQMSYWEGISSSGAIIPSSSMAMSKDTVLPTGVRLGFNSLHIRMELP